MILQEKIMDSISLSPAYFANTSASSRCAPGCDCAACQNSAAVQSKLQAQGNNTSGLKSENLTPEEQKAVETPKKTDRAVRQHELAHMSAAAGLSHGGASYRFVTGPDGQRYAVAGEVQIDISAGNTPEETLRKARIIQAAALAPADPSGQDRAIAAQAQSMELQAQSEISQRSPAQQKIAGHYQSDPLPSFGFSTRA